jgi:hypothetical protein
VLFPLSYVRASARLESNQHACRIRAVLSTELRAYKPPAGVEPAPRPYKGRVLPLTLRRQGGDGRSRTRASSVQARCSNHQSFIPKVRTDGVEPPQPKRRGYNPGSSPLLSVRVEGWPIGFEPTLRGSRPRVLPLHHSHHGTGATGVEPATSRLTSECSAQLSYAPEVARLGFEPRVSSS